MILFLRNLFLNDIWLKLFSLALAILMWLTISFAIQKEVPPTPSFIPRIIQRVTFRLPVMVLSSADDTRSIKVEPQEVDVMVEGDAKRIEALQKKELRALVDLSGIEAAQNLVKRIEIFAPQGVGTFRVTPPEVKIIIPPKS